MVPKRRVEKRHENLVGGPLSGLARRPMKGALLITVMTERRYW